MSGRSTKAGGALPWLSVVALAARWKISRVLVRAIPRSRLPFLTFGKSNLRRYDPADVEAYEEESKRVAPDVTAR